MDQRLLERGGIQCPGAGHGEEMDRLAFFDGGAGLIEMIAVIRRPILQV